MSKKNSDWRAPVDCVILAAGLSTRTGTWKMLLPYKGATIIDTAINNALSLCQRVILLTGHRADELSLRYRDRKEITLIHNVAYKDGMFSSVKAGMQAVQTDFAFICPGDMPCIHSSTYRALWLARGDYTLIPSLNRRCGHPVLLPSPIISQIQSLQDSSLRQIIHHHPVNYLNVNDKGILMDIDTLQDYQLLQDELVLL